MAHLSELQIEKIKEHMLHEEAALKIKFKAKRNVNFNLEAIDGILVDKKLNSVTF